MSSSAPKLQREPAVESATAPSPFCYAEAQPSAGGPSADSEKAAEERIRRREADAVERGREAARLQLQATLDAAVARGRGQILQALTEFARERAAYYRRVEGEVVHLALAIARKVLHRESQIDPQVLAGIVRVALEKLDTGTRVDLHVRPQEATDWRHYFACQAEGAVVPEVHEDPSLPEGQCRVETTLGSTEIGIESQLREIETGLLDLLAERPDGASSATAATSSSPLSARSE